ncbi:MAG: holo-ACP synthase [bacterium]
MIEGIGIDLVDIGKMKKILQMRGEKFCYRVFSEKEVETIESAKNKNENRGFQKAAGYFAAKEAFLKALGSGLFSVPLNKIAVLNNESGQPYINLDNDTAVFLNRKFKKNISNVKVSITHENGFACAMVIVQ